jgi:hypothetical protein
VRHQIKETSTGSNYHVIAGGAPVTVLSYDRVVTIESGVNRFSAPIQEWAILAENALADQVRHAEHAAKLDDLLSDDLEVVARLTTTPAPVEVIGPDPSAVKLRVDLINLLVAFRGADARAGSLVDDAAVLERYILKGDVSA